MLLAELIFFFSSRRRHTRLQGDWSSDVCSSDLCHLAHCSCGGRWPSTNLLESVSVSVCLGFGPGAGFTAAQHASIPRSPRGTDRKSTRLNSSHLVISYAVFCLKKKQHIT